ncbi:MAG: CBS domain-containing protein [Rhodopila sp.]|nr:CBS domain-containing protein [Rhodopila sp.]
MRAQDVMTTQVVAVEPDTPVREIATIMIERRITGLPVQEPDGRLVGIVTDGDIYRRSELGTDRRRRRSWLELFAADPRHAQDYVEAHGRTARDVMTANVVAVVPETSLRQIADVLETRRIRRVPVVTDGKVVGIVSRANLVQALATSTPPEADSAAGDRRTRDMLIAEYARHPWGLRAEANVVVTDGVVHIFGLVDSEAEQHALRVAAEGIPGVKGFEDHTVGRLGDVGARPRINSTITVVEPDRAG